MSVRRPDDLFVADIWFSGFRFRKNPPRLERASADAFVVVEFPPQSFGEEAHLATSDEDFKPESPAVEQVEVSSDPAYPPKNAFTKGVAGPTALPASRIRMSGPSRVALSMPPEFSMMGFDLATVLSALRQWPMRLNGNAVPDPSPLRVELLRAVASLGVSQGVLQEDAADVLVRAGAMPSTLSPPGASFGGGFPLLSARGPHPPAANATALEVPYRLVLSPLAPARWMHAIRPVVRRERTELWHTRLTTSSHDTGADSQSRVRALWSPDYRSRARQHELMALISAPTTPPTPNPDLIRMSLDPLDRSMLVTLMSGFDATRENGARFVPRSAAADRLHLSALGALVDIEGSWMDTPGHIDLEQWRHLGTLGRDHYVRVVYAGYLCPFGHAASLVKVTERKFESLVRGRVALLRQRFFLVVREPVRPYSGVLHVHQCRDFPFRQIEILTRVTPDLSEPGIGPSALKGPPNLYAGVVPGVGVLPRMLFWPMTLGAGAPADVPFEFAAIGLDGQRLTCAMPMLFIGKVAERTRLDDIKEAYNADVNTSRRRTRTGGAVITFAPSDPSDEGDPRLPTASVTFRAGNTVGSRAPRLHPEIQVAEVGIKPVQKLLNKPDFVVEVAYPSFYTSSGFDPVANAGKVFLQTTKAEPLGFGSGASQATSDALGALATPAMNLLGLSKTLGPVAGKAATGIDAVRNALDSVKNGEFDPLQFFNDAKILGGITLADLLGKVIGLTKPDAPKMLSRDFPDRVEASWTWETEIAKSDPLSLLIPRADKSKPPTRLKMHGLARTPRDASLKPTAEATASLDNFKVNLFGFIILWFERIDFVAKPGTKPDVTVSFRDSEDAVRFGGALEFVNELRKAIPSKGFADRAGLSVTPSGISASYSLTLPAIQVGVFALSNASLGAGFRLPFDAAPMSVNFSFSKRESPFSLTVSLLGGGGFFLIGISARGVNEIEASLELGAVLAIDLGVASGSVEAKVGIYFHWLEKIPDKGSVELAGFVRIRGELTVLKIISVTLTFNLQLGFLKADGKTLVYGEATLTVEIEILMFSVEVSVKCRREFSGAEADPRFIDLVPTAALWTEYCDAYAEEVA